MGRTTAVAGGVAPEAPQLEWCRLSITVGVPGRVGAEVGLGAERLTAGLAGDWPEVGQPSVPGVPVGEPAERVRGVDLERFLRPQFRPQQLAVFGLLTVIAGGFRRRLGWKARRD